MGKRKEAPEIDHPNVVSVSQIETFLLCKRKWAYLKIDGLKDEGNKSSQLGGRVHDLAEDYFKEGAPIDPNSQEGRILMPALPHLPPPKYPGMLVEEWFFFELTDGFLRGLKDLTIPDGWQRSFPWVSDHKTTKSFEWAKSPSDLLGDIQAGSYSYDAYLKYKPVAIDLQWTYMRTTGSPKAEPTRVTMDYDSMMRVIEKVDQTTTEIGEVRRLHTVAETVPQNVTACDAFGGCRFRDRCKPTPQQRFKAIMTQTNTESSFLERLKKRKEQKSKENPEQSEAKTTVKTSPAASKSTKTSSTKKTASNSSAAINPPEEKEAPSEEELQAGIEEEKAKKTTRKKTSRKKTSTTTGLTAGALLDAILEDLATRIAEKLKESEEE